MRCRLFLASLAFPLATAAAQANPSAQHSHESKAVVVTPDAIQWGPAPTILPAGAKVAVLEGDPGPWKLVYVNPADQPKTSSSQ